MTRILGINTSHNGSIAVIEDGEIVFYLEEERVTRQKQIHGADILVAQAIEKFDKFDYIFFNSTMSYNESTNMIINYLSRHPKTSQTPINYVPHHNAHALSTLYTSPFKGEDCLAIIVDGAGEMFQSEQGAEGYETESVFKFTSKHGLKPLYKRIGTNSTNLGHNADLQFDLESKLKGCEINVSSHAGITKCYESVCTYLGYKDNDAGKIMGFASYGIPFDDTKLMRNGHGDSEYFGAMYPGGAGMAWGAFKEMPIQDGPKEIQEDEKKFEWYMDLAATIQDETQNAVLDLIKKWVNKTGIKNVCLAGGYTLNSVANAYYKSQLPDVNIWAAPIANDGGISIGCAYAGYDKDFKGDFKAIATLALGNEYKVTEDIINLKEFKNFNFEKIGDEECAKQAAKDVAGGNAIAWHFGKSEAGPRALGQRSIISDPRDNKGRSKINNMKGREWFRPLAGSMLHEHYDEWFNQPELKDSVDYMMYVIKSKQDDKIPAMVHIDGTCRVQTVKDTNKNYHNLISEFYRETGVPMVLNTSYNLAGDPLCETVEDSLRAFRKMDRLVALYVEGYKVTRKDKKD